MISRLSKRAAGERRVHAVDGHGAELVRYERAGWLVERDNARDYVSTVAAARIAARWGAAGGTVHLGLPGGEAFDQLVRSAA